MIHHHSSGKRGLWKRIFSMCIALVLICGVTVPASSVSASEATDGTVQVQEEQTLKNDSTQPSDVPKAGGEEETEEQTPGTGGTEEGTDSSVPEATYNFLVEGEVYAAQTVKDGETLSEPAAPEAEGKTFDGWYTAETGGEKFTAFGVQTVTETKTVDLYAGWQEAQEQEEEPGTDEGTTSPTETTEETVPGEENGETTQPADTTGEQEQNGNDEEIPPSNVNGLTGATENANGGTSTLSISGPKIVKVGQTITLTGTESSSYHYWSTNNDSIRIKGNGRTATVTGQFSGSATITHRYTSTMLGWYDWPEEEEYTITVTENSQPGTYKLYMYTLIPGKTMDTGENPDSVWNGMGVGNISNVSSPEKYDAKYILYSGDEEIRSRDNINFSEEKYPPITVDDKTYQYAKTDAERDQEGYYTIQWVRVIVDSGANAGNNGYNDTVPSTEKTYHLDGVIVLNETDMVTVNFYLKDVESNDFEIVNMEKYSQRVPKGTSGSNLLIPDKAEPSIYSPTKVKEGVQYEFDGWYYDETCTQKVDWNSEKVDTNKNYYARYIPVTNNIRVTKNVTGSLGDVQKEFSFKYEYMDAFGESQKGTFTLKDDQTSVPIEIPVGRELFLTEVNASGYTTSAFYNNQTVTATENEINEDKVMVIAIVDNQNEIVVTNHKDAIPDTGIHLTTWPYVMTFAFAGIGAVTFGLYKYRRRDS